MCHVTHRNEPCHTHEQVMSHMWISRHIYEYVTSYIWMRHVTRMPVTSRKAANFRASRSTQHGPAKYARFSNFPGVPRGGCLYSLSTSAILYFLKTQHTGKKRTGMMEIERPASAAGESCMWICVYVYYVWMFVYTYMFTYIYICMYIRIRSHTCICENLHAFVLQALHCDRSVVYIYVYICIYTYMYMYLSKYTYTYICTYTYMYLLSPARW